MIAQLKFRQAPISIIRPQAIESYKHTQYDLNKIILTLWEQLVKRRTSIFVLMNRLRTSRCMSSLSFLMQSIIWPRYINDSTYLMQKLHNLSCGNDIDTICERRLGWNTMHRVLFSWQVYCFSRFHIYFFTSVLCLAATVPHYVVKKFLC